MLDTNKLIKKLESMIEENNKTMEEDMDGDCSCEQENDTLGYVINMIERGEYNLEKSVHFIKETDSETN